MSLVAVPVVTAPDSEVAWGEGERAVAVAMSAANMATVGLVEAMVDVLARDGWHGWGIQSPVHWLCWKANISRHRAEGIVRIARRQAELPECWALFAAGKVTEDAMVRIARRVPGSHDGQVARVVLIKTIAQLDRALSGLPELPDPDKGDPPARPRYFRRHLRADGSERGEYDLAPEQAAVWAAGLAAARQAVFRDRNNLPQGSDVGDEARAVTWADAAERMAADATDVNDATLQRTGHPGDRHHIVLHHHIDDGDLGPGRLHLGGILEPDVARYFACDAHVLVVAWVNGRLVGIKPTDRTPNRALRRALEHRDGGCAHPLCVQKRWLHAHHIRHWEDGGLTIAANLVMLCPLHHRALHAGDFTLHGNPDDGTLTFRDKHGRPIEPPQLGAHLLPHPAPPTEMTYTAPYGGRLSTRDLIWN